MFLVNCATNLHNIIIDCAKSASRVHILTKMLFPNFRSTVVVALLKLSIIPIMSSQWDVSLPPSTEGSNPSSPSSSLGSWVHSPCKTLHRGKAASSSTPCSSLLLEGLPSLSTSSRLVGSSHPLGLEPHNMVAAATYTVVVLLFTRKMLKQLTVFTVV